MTRLTAVWRTSLAGVVLAAFTTVVAAGTLFACPFVQAPSCCSKPQSDPQCPAGNPESCLLAIAENKIEKAKPRIAATIVLPAVTDSAPRMAPAAEPARPPAETRGGRETYLLNRVLLI